MLLILLAGLAAGTAAFFSALIALQLVRLLVSSGAFRSGPKGLPALIMERLSRIDAALTKNPRSIQSLRIRALTAFLVFVALIPTPVRILFMLTISFLVFIWLGKIYVLKKRRQKETFENQLSEMFAMIASSVRSGQSFAQALESAQGSLKEPVSGLIASVLEKTRLGIPAAQALQEAAATSESRDLKAAVNAINISRETGGNMGEMLLKISGTIAERKRLRGKLNALTSQGRASAMVMSVVPFFLLIVMYALEPSLTGLLFTETAGNLMLVGAVIMVSVGNHLAEKIVASNGE